jgi:hypothetical protein
MKSGKRWKKVEKTQKSLEEQPPLLSGTLDFNVSSMACQRFNLSD